MFNATRLLCLSAIIALSLSTPATASALSAGAAFMKGQPIEEAHSAPHYSGYKLIGLQGCNAHGACGQLYTDSVYESLDPIATVEGCKAVANILRGEWAKEHGELESYKVWCAKSDSTGYSGKL